MQKRGQLTLLVVVGIVILVVVVLGLVAFSSFSGVGFRSVSYQIGDPVETCLKDLAVESVNEFGYDEYKNEQYINNNFMACFDTFLLKEKGYEITNIYSEVTNSLHVVIYELNLEIIGKNKKEILKFGFDFPKKVVVTLPVDSQGIIQKDVEVLASTETFWIDIPQGTAVSLENGGLVQEISIEAKDINPVFEEFNVSEATVLFYGNFFYKIQPDDINFEPSARIIWKIDEEKLQDIEKLIPYEFNVRELTGNLAGKFILDKNLGELHITITEINSLMLVRTIGEVVLETAKGQVTNEQVAEWGFSAIAQAAGFAIQFGLGLPMGAGIVISGLAAGVLGSIVAMAGNPELGANIAYYGGPFATMQNVIQFCGDLFTGYDGTINSERGRIDASYRSDPRSDESEYKKGWYEGKYAGWVDEEERLRKELEQENLLENPSRIQELEDGIANAQQQQVNSMKDLGRLDAITETISLDHVDRTGYEKGYKEALNDLYGDYGRLSEEEINEQFDQDFTEAAEEALEGYEPGDISF